MYVKKRDGRLEPVHFDKITERITRLCYGLNPDYVDPILISQKVCMGVYKNVTTAELDELAAETAAHLTSIHPDFGILATRIAVSNLHKSTSKSIADVAKALYNYVEPRTKMPAPLINKNEYHFIIDNADALNSAIKFKRDYLYDYFGFKTLQHSYLLKINGKIVGRPQHTLIRKACGLHAVNYNHETKTGGDLEAVLESYETWSLHEYTHATPTIHNSGTPFPQLSSCFLLTMYDDSIEGIYDTLKSTAVISKYEGGEGIFVGNIRAAGSYIKGTGGNSNGLVPMLRVFNATARYVDQCFAPETIVYTYNGPQQIQNIKVGDMMLSTTGKYNPVEKVLKYDFKGKILKIQAKQTFDSVLVTGEHQILALKGQAKGINFSTVKNRLNKGLAKVEMSDAKDLQVGDFICYPIPQDSYEEDIKDLTLDDCRFYGLILGDGWIGGKRLGHEDKEWYNNSGLCFGMVEKDYPLHDFVRKYCKDNRIHVTEVPKENNSIQFLWNTGNKGFKFTRDQVYDENRVKRIDPKFYNLPKEKLLAIIQGIFEADGCIYKECVLEMTSENVIQGVRWMLMKCGILSSGYRRDRVGNVSSYKNITTRLETIALQIPRVKEICDLFPSAPKGKFTTYFVHEGMMYSRIDSITEEDYNGNVYDFEISNEHTYVTGIGGAHNGGGKRKGAFAVYIEPWHADILPFLDLRKNHGAEEERARDLFYGLWIPDLFMERVEADADWPLFCPHEAAQNNNGVGLHDIHSDVFREAFLRLEKIPGLPKKIVKARVVWQAILEAQTETGNPYMMFKDACNNKSNQKNLGTIHCSNLCTEIVQYSDKDEIACCNLASIALPMYITTNLQFDHEKLYRVVKLAEKNLNKVIDINFYPDIRAKNSNFKHRPTGLGVQGLADLFILMRLPFDSEEAQQLNKDIFETMYFAALTASNELAKELGPYESYAGSPISQGILQCDMWGVKPSGVGGRWDWDALRENIKKYGVRNSLLIAPMPTASTSQILGNYECFEPINSNIFVRRTLAGEFVCVNKYLLNDLIKLGIWNHDLKSKLIAHNGSVQNIDEIPDNLKKLYKTVYEISQKTIIDMAADRGAFIDQSQSLNIHMLNVNFGKLTSMHFYAWKKGLKTGMYYLRSKPAVDATKFTVDVKYIQEEQRQKSIMTDLENRKKEKPIISSSLMLRNVSENSISEFSGMDNSPASFHVIEESKEIANKNITDVSESERSSPHLSITPPESGKSLENSVEEAIPEIIKPITQEEAKKMRQIRPGVYVEGGSCKDSCSG